MDKKASHEQVLNNWQETWPRALSIWSRFTRLRDPLWCVDESEAVRQGLVESFAMIRLADQAVVINLEQILLNHVEDYALEILAHEIGHHIYCPSNLTDQARMISRVRHAMPTKENHAGFVTNLYADLLINDRLQRGEGLHMDRVYRALPMDSHDRLWLFYMRTYEILWSLKTGTLARALLFENNDQIEGDAYLCARLIRSYARDWVDGSGRFAALCLPYILENEGLETRTILKGWLDTQNAGSGSTSIPGGLTEIEIGERVDNLHPSLDPTLSGSAPQEQSLKEGETQSTKGQHREPFEYGEILRAMGMDLSGHEIAVRYYRERALPHLVRFPSNEAPESSELIPEGTAAWEMGDPLENIDWLESITLSPHVVPNMTTVQRVWGRDAGVEPVRQPLDLDIYVDSSGSMPNPQQVVSYLTLAGAIIALSALRTGARVQATLWSGARQFETTGGFIQDEHKILQILTGFIGGATAFPIHILRETYQQRRHTKRPAHILIISDLGVTSMFENDEQGNSGFDISRMALENARGGGTMVLSLYADFGNSPKLKQAAEDGWQIFSIQSWEELVQFARRFSAMKYGETQRKAA
jgi:hypothetical protein